MPGELSPDGRHYWDGVRWASAVTPDGAWRWDGRSWQQARRRSGVAGPIAVAIAASTIVALVLAGVGVAFVVRLGMSGQAALQASLPRACDGRNAQAGVHLSEGYSLCGRPLGTTYLSADCTQSTSLPSGVDAVEMRTTDKDWSSADVSGGAGGCTMVASPNQILSLEGTAEEPPGVIVIADFVPVTRSGSLGLRIACVASGSCIDVTLYADMTYSLDEAGPGDTWKNITKGPFVFTPRVLLGQVNRLILRLAAGTASVFLNGFEITHGRPTIPQTRGYVDFYVDDEGGSVAEQVQLRDLYSFEAL